MAVTYGFFNSVNGDRKYNADQISEYFEGIVSQGVFQSLDSGMAVSAGTGLTVNVAAGRAIVQNHWIKNDATLTLDISAASTTYARIDAVVLRFSSSNRNITIAVKTGTPAASPSAPSMTRSGGTYEMALAYVNVAANATSVTVTDKRSDTSVCGWAAVAQSIDGTYEAMIDAMKTGFDGVVYPSPVAMVQGCDTKLQGEIEAIEASMEDFEDSTFNKTLVKSKNLLNWATINTGKILANDGTLSDNDYRWTTDYIPIPADKRSIISTFLFTDSLGQQYRSSRTWTNIAAYDSSKNYIADTYSSTAASTYTAGSDNVAFVRISYNPNNVGSQETDKYLMIEYGTSVTDYEPYFDPYYDYTLKSSCLPEDIGRPVINIVASDGITSFYEKMTQAYNTGDCDVYIGKGDYTYTNALMEQIRTAGKRGVPIGNGCRYYFETGAKLYCEYTGTNKSDIVEYFSPLDSQNTGGDYEIYNLDLVAKNVCYAIHDEAYASTDFCKHIYKDCYVTLDNSALAAAEGNQYSKALGGGLGCYEEIIIENCVFSATNPSKRGSSQDDASYHGANAANTDAKIVITGCWFANRFRTSNVATNTIYPRIIISNNSFGAALNIDANWSAKIWNNETRV